jgi:uncharacterized small protein (DUF1192 family)
MAKSDDDPWNDPPSPAMRGPHQIGAPLDHLSIEEIDERIAALRLEIQRLETQRAEKEDSRRAANAFFKL